ncbi:hypothetical protein ACFQH9_02140 [Pseudonocardia lutea]|uniref:Phage tail protein n=1 Tax=Pseudonocardia lutea TaxID=2172015 RepID=A0ABW1I0C0_9PSEU
MAVTVSNLIMGPGTLYRAAVDAVEPEDTAVNSTPAASAYTDVGGTMDGVTLAINQEYTELAVDQVIDVPGRRKTKREFTIQTNLAEPTLENLAFVMNEDEATAVTTGTGFKKLEPSNDTSATQPVYSKLLFDGFAPDSLARRVIGRKMLSTDNVEFAYSKENQTVFTATFSGHYVSPSIKPFVVIDEDAA